jgi:hypothetical protein
MPQNFLDSTRRSVTLLKQKWDAQELTISPPFQRNAVWSDNQKSFLIDTILRGYPIPELYIQESVDSRGVERFTVVDGQQRIRACLEYIAGQYELSEPEDSQWYGKNFSDLSNEERQRIYSYNFMVRQLPDVTKLELVDIFKRINRYTVSLNQQELRHATYWGEFIQSMERIAEDPLWSELGVFSSNDVRRMLDVEFISELAIGLLHGVQNKKLSMDRYFVLHEKDFEQRDDVERTFRLITTELKGIFALLQSSSRWKKKSDFYSLFLVLAKSKAKLPLTSTGRKGIAGQLQTFGDAVDRFLTSDSGPVRPNVRRYALAVERAATDLANRRTRQEVLEKLFSRRGRS